jgi:hypothetical protein
MGSKGDGTIKNGRLQPLLVQLIFPHVKIPTASLAGLPLACRWPRTANRKRDDAPPHKPCMVGTPMRLVAQDKSRTAFCERESSKSKLPSRRCAMCTASPAFAHITSRYAGAGEIVFSLFFLCRNLCNAMVASAQTLFLDLHAFKLRQDDPTSPSACSKGG